MPCSFDDSLEFLEKVDFMLKEHLPNNELRAMQETHAAFNYTAAEGTVFEVIAALQEQPAQAQEERCENPAQGPSDPSSEQQPEGKPRCTSYYFKFMIPIYVSITCALSSMSCLEP